MTTREATGLLPRMGDTPVIGSDGRSFGDWATLLSIGAIQWPWLLRSLYGGRLADKHELLDRLELPYDALPFLGSWKADTGLLTLLVDHILEQKPNLVVEFGTGASTLVISRALQRAGGGRLISFDQHADFIDATRAWLAEFGMTADLRAVPLRPSPGGRPGLWYDHGPLPKGIDLMLIDGPPWSIHPFTRGAAASLFDHVSPGGTVMLDDGARPGERVIARRWRRAHPEFDFVLDRSGTKGTLIGRKRR
ncbi:MAG: class I SAM-dependent methyltransferase [Sphingomonas sp.]